MPVHRRHRTTVQRDQDPRDTDRIGNTFNDLWSQDFLTGRRDPYAATGSLLSSRTLSLFFYKLSCIKCREKDKGRSLDRVVVWAGLSWVSVVNLLHPRHGYHLAHCRGFRLANELGGGGHVLGLVSFYSNALVSRLSSLPSRSGYRGDGRWRGRVPKDPVGSEEN